MNKVSTSGDNRRLAIIIVSSAAMSVSGRTPRIMTCAPQLLTNSTASPENVRISRLSTCDVANRINSVRSSTSNIGVFSMLIPTPTISRSNSRLIRSMTFKCPRVIGSNEPG